MIFCGCGAMNYGLYKLAMAKTDWPNNTAALLTIIILYRYYMNFLGKFDLHFIMYYTYVTLHEKTMHKLCAEHQSEIKAKIVAYGDNHQFSVFGIDR